MTGKFCDVLKPQIHTQGHKGHSSRKKSGKMKNFLEESVIFHGGLIWNDIQKKDFQNIHHYITDIIWTVYFHTFHFNPQPFSISCHPPQTRFSRSHAAQEQVGNPQEDRDHQLFQPTNLGTIWTNLNSYTQVEFRKFWTKSGYKLCYQPIWVQFRKIHRDTQVMKGWQITFLWQIGVF